MFMTKDREGEQKPKLNRGIEYMLRSEKYQKKDGLFNFKISKIVSFFSKEIHLKIELKITERPS
jgi:hypothetical protein